MRKYLLVILFSLLNLVAYTQALRGTVSDAKTKNVIPFASVYFNGTFVGTISNQHGYFELDRSNNQSMPLIISAIGYYSVTLTDLSSAKPLLINLKPKEYTLKEAVVKSTSLVKKRKRYLATFKAEFLGTTRNAGKCRILNENDITFDYNSNADTLKAYALKPIQVENRALGYTVTYYLDKFEYYRNPESVFFIGNIKFRENKTTEDSLKLFVENRKRAYQGSKMHFFRSLCNNNLEAQGFIILTPANESLRVKDIVVRDSTNNNYLHYSSRFNIWNKNKGTSVNFLKKYVYFDKTGYFDPSGINWIGSMGDGRIADWLPYEYTIEK